MTARWRLNATNATRPLRIPPQAAHRSTRSTHSARQPIEHIAPPAKLLKSLDNQKLGRLTRVAFAEVFDLYKSLGNPFAPWLICFFAERFLTKRLFKKRFPAIMAARRE